MAGEQNDLSAAITCPRWSELEIVGIDTDGYDTSYAFRLQQAAGTFLIERGNKCGGIDSGEEVSFLSSPPSAIAR
ncbi:MAG TPA: hypothetical protein PKJ41_21435 [Bryobacteraceae bacterium]|nr:hypothetical protein [Bryobacteraceae bacterium]